MVDGPGELREGSIHKFCFLRLDLVGSADISRSNPTRDITETFSGFFQYAERHVKARGGRTWSLTGDGALFAFYGNDLTTVAEQGALAALDIINHLDDFHATRSRVKQRISARAAVHLGDARYDDKAGPLRGDDRDLLSHLGGDAAFPDSVSISNAVYRELESSDEVRRLFHYNGTFEGHPIFSTVVSAKGLRRSPAMRGGTWRTPAVATIIVFIAGLAVLAARDFVDIGADAVVHPAWLVVALVLFAAAVAAVRSVRAPAGPRVSASEPDIDVEPDAGPEEAAVDGQRQKGRAASPREERDEPTGPRAGEPRRIHRLPADLRDFTGREQEVDELLRFLKRERAQAGIAAITGAPGVGKSALAIHLAHRLETTYPDARIFVDLQGTSPQPLTPAQAMARVIRAFHPSTRLSHDPFQVEQFYRSVLSDKRVLIVLDNAANAAQAQPLRPPPSCAVILTMRRDVDRPGFRAFHLVALLEQKARQLLENLVRRGGSARRELDSVLRLCGRLPLALRVAGGSLAMHPYWGVYDYSRALAKERDRLSWQRQDGLEVEAVLALTADNLKREHPELALRWRMLTVFPATFDATATAAVWDLDPGETGNLLSELIGNGLVAYDEASERYRMHDLVRSVAQNSLAGRERKSAAAEEREQIEKAASRHAAHYESVLRSADQLYQEGGEGIERALDLFDAEWENIQAGQARSGGHAQKDDALAELCSAYPDAGANLLALRLDMTELIRWREEALAAARRLQKRAAESMHLGHLGRAYAAQGDTERAIKLYNEQVRVAREIGDRGSEGDAQGNLGRAYAAQGETERAIGFYEQALEIDREVNDLRREGSNLRHLGDAYMDQGEAGRAIECYERALGVGRVAGDRHSEGVVLGELGNAACAMGEMGRAIEVCEEGLTILRALGDRRGEGVLLGYLGNAYFGSGEALRAVDCFEKALAIGRETGNRRNGGILLSNLGGAYFASGETRRAVEFCEQGLTMLGDPGQSRGQKKGPESLQLASASPSEARRAVSFCEQCLTVFRETGNLRGEARALFIMSLALDRLGRRPRAIASAEAALNIYDQTANPNAGVVQDQIDRWREKE